MKDDYIKMLMEKPSSELWSKERQNATLQLLLEIRSLLKK